MMDALKEAAPAPAPAGKAFFNDELVLLDFNAAAAAGELQPHALLFQDFFDPSVDDLPVPGLPVESGGGRGDEEEEELEWLANKDAFPSLETSFEIPAHSLSGSSSGWSGGAAAAAAREGPSPVSVLASAVSFSAPARPRSKGRTQRRRLLTSIPPQPAMATATKARAAERRRCRHCLAEETPQWRMGPEGPKTLCNACGVRYKSGRLVPEYRPANSPTFSGAIHSNSHRQILEMRRQKEAPHERKNTSPQPPLPPLVTPPVKLIPMKTKKIKK